MEILIFNFTNLNRKGLKMYSLICLYVLRMNNLNFMCVK